MEKQILKFALMILFCIGQQTNAQTPLTNRQIFDFNPGDVIQGTHFFKFEPGPPSYETYTYLKRTLSKTNDTLYYRIRREYYTPPACENCKPLIWIDTITQAYMELDSIAKHYNETTQCSVVDTFYNEFCNKRVWGKKPGVLDSNSFEPVLHYTYYVEGLGGPYYVKEFSQGGLTKLDYVLTYYSKNGTSCGNYVSGVNTLKKQELNVKIAPNPMNDKAILHFEKALTNGQITLYNFDGQILRELHHIQGNEYEFSRNDLPSGIYFIKTDEQQKSNIQRIVIE